MKKNLKMHKALCLVFIFLFTLFSKNIALAETKDISVETFEKMSDEYMKKALDKYKVAGATVSVVKDDKVFFKKGYGYSDMSKKTVVNADTTAFQIASVSKLFTATAVMKLSEDGKISLDEDVNKYLKVFKIKNKFSKPVTVRNLLNHTSGFDEKSPMNYRTKGDKFYENIEELGDFLKKDIPEVINEPGAITQYNVYNYAILGYLIETVSGKAANEYITDEILKPLNMKNSSYWITKNILGSMSKPYKYENGKYIEDLYSMPVDHPSGAICSTASDMANFMLMQLNNGEYNNAKILNSESVQAMHTSDLYKTSNILGFGLGFFQNKRTGYITLEHNGTLPSFHSLLTIMPEKNMGMFISINTESNNSSEMCNEYADKFYEFFKLKSDDVKDDVKIKDSKALSMNSKEINGTYVPTSFYPHRGVCKVLSIIPFIGAKIEYEESTGNMISYVQGKKSIIRHVDKDIFYDDETSKYIKVVKQGNRMYILNGVSSLEKISNIDKCLAYMMIGGVITALLGCAVLLASLIRNKDNMKKIKILLLAMSFSICMYAGLNGILLTYIDTGNMNVINNIITPFIRINAYLTFIATLICIREMFYSCKSNDFSKVKKAFYSIIIIFAIVFIVFMYRMNGFY